MQFNIKTYEDKQKEVETQRISLIDNHTQNFIYSKYSKEKQTNALLGIYPDEYKNEIIAFISKIRELNHKAVKDGLSLDEFKALLENINNS